MIYQLVHKFVNLDPLVISIVYGLEITNASAQHLIYMWTWYCLVKHYMESLEAVRKSREQEK